jgi:environmental stress-induced protein Ves
LKVLRQADYPSQAWKNGRGSSRRIAAYPEGAGFDDGLLWQLSLPVIAADSPFSAFPGFDRQFMILSGEGVALSFLHPAEGIAFSKTIDRALQPFAFRGEWPAECRLLGGPVEDFSLLTRRGTVAARLEMRAMHALSVVEKAADETLLIYTARGSLRVLGQGDAAVLAEQDSLLDASGKAATFSLSPAAGNSTVAALLLISQLK